MFSKPKSSEKIARQLSKTQQTYEDKLDLHASDLVARTSHVDNRLAELEAEKAHLSHLRSSIKA